MSETDTRLNFINEYIEKEYRIIEQSADIGRKISYEIQELLLHSSPIIWELPLDCCEPIQQISAVYPTKIDDDYNIVFSINCFDFHTMSAWRSFQSLVGDNSAKILRYNEIKKDGIYYIPLTFYSVNKNIKHTLPYSVGATIREFFFRRELETMNFSDSYYDWNLLKPMVEDETSRFHRLATAFRDMAFRNLMIYYNEDVENFAMGWLNLSAKEVFNGKLYKTMIFLQNVLGVEYDVFAEQTKISLSFVEFRQMINTIISFIPRLIAKARFWSLGDEFLYGGLDRKLMEMGHHYIYTIME